MEKFSIEEIDEALLVHMHLDEDNQTKIGKAIGCSQSNISKFMNRQKGLEVSCYLKAMNKYGLFKHIKEIYDEKTENSL